MNVAILKNSVVINVLVFGDNASDSEIQTFAEIAGGDDFQKLAFNQKVVNGEIETAEKPSAEAIWSSEKEVWEGPYVEYPTPPADAQP